MKENILEHLEIQHFQEDIPSHIKGGIEIPLRLQNDAFSFCKVRYKGMQYKKKNPKTGEWEEALANGKEGFPTGWNTPEKAYRYDDEGLFEWIDKGHPYGMVLRDNQVVIDVDQPWVEKTILESLKDKGLYETFRVRTGSGKPHIYFYSNGNEEYQARDSQGNTLVEIRGRHNNGSPQMVLGPGSPHPDGGFYEVENDTDIAFADYNTLLEIVRSVGYIREQDKKPESKSQRKKKKSENPLIDKVNETVTIPMVLDHYGVEITKPGRAFCPKHGGKSGTTLNFTDVKAKCFYCHGKGEGWNIWSMVEEMEGCNSQEATRILCEIGGIEGYKEDWTTTSEWRELARSFHEIQPYFFDSNYMWWLWNKQKYRWEIKDQVDLMNAFDKHFVKATEDRKLRSELIEALKKVGRLKRPKEAPETWIQFHDTIVDVYNPESQREASPEFFHTNTLSWTIGKSEDTSTIDRLLREWVVGGNQDESFVQTLYEIIAFCLLTGYPIQRLFVLLGYGCNGKSTFLRLLVKFLGKENWTATDLARLMSGRFETAKLYRKLLCVIGEIGRTTLKQTNLLKALTGNDPVAFEFKNKSPFEDICYAKIVMAANRLPETVDRSDGFYRRWLIVDFPNRFPEGKDIISDIPEWEFENLARKSIRILRELLERGSFTNEGTIEHRKERYEEKSSSLDKFIEEFCVECHEGFIPVENFYDLYSSYLQENGAMPVTKASMGRAMSGRGMKSEKYSDGAEAYRIYRGLKWREDILTD
jgi:P4 family phage/plasmid primase-like protien